MPTISDLKPRFLRNDYKSWKIMTGWHAYGMLAFHPYRWNQLKVIPVACTPGLYSAHEKGHSNAPFGLILHT